MNLSIYFAGYLAERLKDTTHLGNHKVFRHAKSSHIQQTPEDLLLQQLGWEKSGDIPLAALLHAAEMNKVKSDIQPQAQAYKSTAQLWLVQAVHMALQRDTFSLQEVVPLTADEYQTLTALLNSHFKADGYQFLTSQQQQYWFLSAQQALHATTHLAQAVLNQNVQFFQPTGKDAKALRQIMNEAQMLLHEHTINQARQTKQMAAVNSIWLSGGGGLSATLNSHVDALIGDSALSKGVAAVSHLASDADIEMVLASSAKQAVMHVDALENAAWDVVYAALKRNKIKQLNIYFPIGNGSLHLQQTPLDALKFWQKPLSLDMHLQKVYGQH